jgi:hypothetical protein
MLARNLLLGYETKKKKYIGHMPVELDAMCTNIFRVYYNVSI